MSVLEAADSPRATGVRRRHPHPGEGIPTFAWPTFGLAVGGIAVFVWVAVGAVRGSLPAWVVIPLSTLVTYVMFSVAHEALHRSFCSVRWVNAVVGRLAWLLVVLPFSLPAFGYVHGEHHRHTNDPERDPDMFATHAPTWQLPIRWVLLDLFNATWYVRTLWRRIRHSWRRPVAELAETSVLFSLTVTMTVAAILTDHFWLLAELVLIPQRLGLFIIGWAFDWLPHHGIKVTQREDRYRASRLRGGMEWLMAPLMLSQNYHLIHHLHPWLPFYRYLSAWRRNEELYLEHDAAVTTLFGRELNAEESLHWKTWARVQPESVPV
ncbi:fatty acid desaturase [[Mycobacterium] crassicus]|uniref:Fatty acid desaturase n=1 Tax=[Mycobacterium] crassicus TaxID=2872309 RepID=A0ABU5XK01_9MYCO|nr:fatty acid desaturase [Mycolicibacter sp. MYC098]MEB3021662.1 fatty acid desaturase [Mycolicibacter sp. MYC098]